jgi:hypothetical protein
MMRAARKPIENFIAIVCVAVGLYAGATVHGLLAGPRSQTTIVAPVSLTQHAAASTIVAAEPPAIVCSTASHCRIDLQRLQATPMQLPRGLRLVPADHGLQLQGVRGLLAELGLRDGDVLTAIDGDAVDHDTLFPLLHAAVARGGFALAYRRGTRARVLRVELEPGLQVHV